MPARLLRSSFLIVAALCVLPGSSVRALAADTAPAVEVVTAVEEGRYEEALGLLGEKPAALELQYLAARCLAELGRFEEALQVLPEPARVWPDAVRADVKKLQLSWAAEASRCQQVAALAEGTADASITRFLARCAFNAGDFGRARELLVASKDADGRSMYVRALFQLGERDTAIPLARTFVVQDAAHTDAETILALLRDADRRFTLTPEEHFDRAEALIGARRPEDALAELDKLGKQKERALEGRRQHLRGEALFKTRTRYPEASKAFARAAALGGPTEAYDAFHSIRATSRAGRDRPAITRYRAFAKRYAKSPLAPDALYLAAWLSARNGLPNARAELARFLASDGARRQPGLAREAAWDLGWLAFNKRDFAAADTWLTRYERDAENELERSRGTYWLARAHRQAGRKTQARELFIRVMERERFGYYPQMAVRQLEAMGERPPPNFDASANVPPLPDVVLPPAAAFYAVLGLHADAARATEQSFVQGNDKAQRVALLLRAGDAAKTFSAAQTFSDVALKAGPQAASWLWSALFPRPYQRLVQQETSRHGLESALFYGHMQIESRYRPDVVSSADAIGLMQMLPSTAAAVAKRVGGPASRRALKQPHVNIALGAAYLGQLVVYYKGQFPLAIAAYNAGTERVDEWVKRTGTVDTDRWVEEIPVEQTRNYVRRVLGAWARYRMLEVPTSPWGIPIPRRVGMRKK
jgi:soluble lytic murein transglycosylase